MRRLFLVAVIVGLALAAWAAWASEIDFGTDAPPMDIHHGLHARFPAPGGGGTPCGAGTLDFTDGCNAVFAVTLL